MLGLLQAVLIQDGVESCKEAADRQTSGSRLEGKPGNMGCRDAEIYTTFDPLVVKMQVNHIGANGAC
jgi:hypothetical protein